MSTGTIIVCGLRHAPDLVEQHKVGAAIGILGPESTHPVFSTLGEGRHLRLSFNDINAPAEGLVAASENDAARLIDFMRAWDRKAPLLIHCWAGISRSTATAFAALCLLQPDVDEFALAQQLRAASPSATPNRLITAQVDAALGRGGRMVAAVESMGRGANAYEGTPFMLQL